MSSRGLKKCIGDQRQKVSLPASVASDKNDGLGRALLIKIEFQINSLERPTILDHSFLEIHTGPLGADCLPSSNATHSICN